MRSLLRFSLAWMILACLPAVAATMKPGAPLDQQKIHAAYNDGNFDYVLSTLEEYQRVNKTMSHADSVFIAKHLAVVYSANPATREKGRYYMNVLLELMPSAKLVDMYVSEEIDRIFDKVREEFISRQGAFGIDSSAVSLPDRPRPGSPAAPATPPPATASERKPKGNTLFWVAGGVGLVAAGTVAYLILADSPKAGKDKTYVIPQ